MSDYDEDYYAVSATLGGAPFTITALGAPLPWESQLVISTPVALDLPENASAKAAVVAGHVLRVRGWVNANRAFAQANGLALAYTLNGTPWDPASPPSGVAAGGPGRNAAAVVK